MRTPKKKEKTHEKRPRGLQNEALRHSGDLRKRPESPLGGPMALQGRFWTMSHSPRGRKKKRSSEKVDRYHSILGSLLAPFRAFSMKLFQPGAEKTQKCKSSFYLRNSLVFEVPVAPKASQNRPGVASRGLVERAEVASSVFGRVASRQSGSEASGLSGPRRKSTALSRDSRRVVKKTI